MTYSVLNPPVRVSETVGGAGTVWTYKSSDAASVVRGTGYFSNGAALGMTVGDPVWVIDSTNNATTLCYVTAVSTTATISYTNDASVGPCKFSNLQTRMHFGRSNFLLTAGLTLSNLYTAETEFDWVQLGYLNYTTSRDIDKVVIACSSKINDGYSPLTAAGTANTWTDVTFNAAGVANVPPAAAGSTATVTLAAGTTVDSGDVPSITWSDWIALPSIARTDVIGALPIVMIRTYAAAQLPTHAPANTTDITVDWAAADEGREFRCYYKTGGDYATTPSGFTTPTEHKYIAPAIVRTMARKRGLTVLGIGDSLTQGISSTSQFASWLHLACCDVSTSTFPVSFANGGWTLQKSNPFYTRGRMLIDTILPDVCFIASWTPNDAPITQATSDLSWARASDLAHYCISKNIVPVLWTPLPAGATDATTDAYRLSVVARVRASGFLYCEFESAMGTGATPNRLGPQTGTPDNTHPGDEGYALMAAIAVPILERIKAARPLTL